MRIQRDQTIPTASKGMKWTIGLVDGESDPMVNTILAAKEKELALLTGLSLQLEAKHDSDGTGYSSMGISKDLRSPICRIERLVPL